MNLRKSVTVKRVKSLLIMCDGEGRLGDPDNKKEVMQLIIINDGSKQLSI